MTDSVKGAAGNVAQEAGDAYGMLVCCETKFKLELPSVFSKWLDYDSNCSDSISTWKPHVMRNSMKKGSFSYLLHFISHTLRFLNSQ